MKSFLEQAFATIAQTGPPKGIFFKNKTEGQTVRVKWKTFRYCSCSAEKSQNIAFGIANIKKRLAQQRFEHTYTIFQRQSP